MPAPTHPIIVDDTQKLNLIASAKRQLVGQLGFKVVRCKHAWPRHGQVLHNIDKDDGDHTLCSAVVCPDPLWVHPLQQLQDVALLDMKVALLLTLPIKQHGNLQSEK